MNRHRRDMNFKVIDRRSLDLSSWEGLTRNGSLFHTHHWADICVEGLAPHVEAVFLCGLENGSLIAGMPAIITKRFGMKSFYSMPYGTYGEAVFAEGTSDDQKREFYNHFAEYIKRNKYSRVAVADFGRNLSLLREPILHHTGTFTHIIDLNGNEEHNPPDKKINGHIRAGQRAGTEIVQVRTNEQLDSFFSLYEITEHRHGRRRPLYSKQFFTSILNHLGDSNILYWNALMADGVMIGSCINFIYGSELFNWQTVSDYESRHLKPNHVLLADAIRRGENAGVNKVNLGASPPDAVGLIDYKERWGGVRIDYDLYSSESWLRRFLRR